MKACATAGFVCNSGMRQRQILLEILHDDHVEGMCNSGIRVQQRDATTTNPSRILHDHVEGMCNSGRQILLEHFTLCATAGCDTTTNPSRIVHDHVEGMCNSGIRVQQRDATTKNPSRIVHDHVEGMCDSWDSCATAGCDNDKSFSNTARSR